MFGKLRNYLPVLVVALACVIPLAIMTKNLSFRFDTDYKVVVPAVQFAVNAVRDPLHYFAWNPYIGLGMPAVSDPTSLLFSPWYMPILLLFNAEAGIRILIGLSIIVAGASMWIFLSSFQMKPWITAWGAILYETSGAFAALVTSGRIERFGSYAVVPYVMYLFWKPVLTVMEQAGIGIIYACMYLSADIYTPWLVSVLYGSLVIYKIINRHQTLGYVAREICVIYISFLVFALPKLLPFIIYAAPYFQRPWAVDPFAGSLHIWLLPLSYIIPWRVAFFDRPFFQRNLGFYFNWYEYFAFISFVPFIALAKLQYVWKKKEILYAIILIIAGGLYLALKYPYSPFYWLFHLIPAVNIFRVPQRITGMLLPAIILVVCICMNYWITHNSKQKIFIYIICIVSVLWTYAVSIRTMKDAFEPTRSVESGIASELRQKDPSIYYVLDLTCCTQPFLVRESIHILNFYYGWMPTYTPRFTNASGDKFDYEKLRTTTPSYIITDTNDTFDEFGYTLYFGRGHVAVWKTRQPTIFPNL